ncbi:hypothetical protein AAVH_35542 [Aphelenchoides avenae]|nr:hypothetical protein AAVH_35542 [Aphelenchus avenae]
MLANVKTSMLVVVALLAPLVVSDLPACREYPATGAGCKCGNTVCAAGLSCAWQSSKGFHCKLYEEDCEDLWDK